MYSWLSKIPAQTNKVLVKLFGDHIRRETEEILHELAALLATGKREQ